LVKSAILALRLLTTSLEISGLGSGRPDGTTLGIAVSLAREACIELVLKLVLSGTGLVDERAARAGACLAAGAGAGAGLAATDAGAGAGAGLTAAGASAGAGAGLAATGAGAGARAGLTAAGAGAGAGADLTAGGGATTAAGLGMGVLTGAAAGLAGSFFVRDATSASTSA